MNYISETIKEFDEEFVGVDKYGLYKTKRAYALKDFLTKSLTGLITELEGKLKLRTSPNPLKKDIVHSSSERKAMQFNAGYNQATREIKQLLKEYK